MDLFNIGYQVLEALNHGTTIRLTDRYGNIAKELIQCMVDFPEKPDGVSEIKFEEYTGSYSKVILVSGGQDSTVMCELHKNSPNVKRIYVDYGQKYAEKEIEALRRQNIEFEIINHFIETNHDWKHIVPTRNFILLAYAEELVKHEGEIWLGAVSGESAPDKGDKSELFFRLFEEYVWRTKRKKVHIKTLKDMTKNDWLKWYIDTTGKTDILNTITCFEGTEKHCGRCQACVRKWIAMKYCNIDQKIIDDMFEVDPYIGGAQYIAKYKTSLQTALDETDFYHYSKERCEQDLQVILNYEKSIR